MCICARVIGSLDFYLAGFYIREKAIILKIFWENVKTNR